ncbi:MAG: FAD-dependent thymidylate synthase [Chloroflexota bacterium]|nr:FAD-dependent thymidylate synthase [Chloroflexota bacterium]MDQ5865630.1 FAD-dependent thymidylate synthase [Chloroflexota bacterium]
MGHIVSQQAEELLDRELVVPSSGFVRLVDYMGSDQSIVQAARVSYGGGTKSVREDRGLIRYLLRHDHTTPFEMVVLKFHIKAPIFVVRQWIRHRTASVNEESARYSIVREEFHEPSREDIGFQSKDNKQGRSPEPVPHEIVDRFLAYLKENRETAYSQYEQFLQDNVARELARTVLPLSVYTQFYWQMNLHNLFHFLRLRLDPHAQKEIRDFAEQVAVCAKAVAPYAWEAFEEYKLHGASFSRTEIDIMQKLLHGQALPPDAFEGSKSLLKEFEAKLGFKVSDLNVPRAEAGNTLEGAA